VPDDFYELPNVKERKIAGQKQTEFYDEKINYK